MQTLVQARVTNLPSPESQLQLYDSITIGIISVIIDDHHVQLKFIFKQKPEQKYKSINLSNYTQLKYL